MRYRDRLAEILTDEQMKELTAIYQRNQDVQKDDRTTFVDKLRKKDQNNGNFVLHLDETQQEFVRSLLAPIYLKYNPIYEDALRKSSEKNRFIPVVKGKADEKMPADTSVLQESGDLEDDVTDITAGLSTGKGTSSKSKNPMEEYLRDANKTAQRDTAILEKLMTSDERIAVFLGYHSDNDKIRQMAQNIVWYTNWNSIPIWCEAKNTGHNLFDQNDRVHDRTSVADIIQEMILKLLELYDSYNILEQREPTFNTYAHQHMIHHARWLCQSPDENYEDAKVLCQILNIRHDLAMEAGISEEEVTFDALTERYSAKYKSKGVGKGMSTARAMRLLGSRTLQFLPIHEIVGNVDEDGDYLENLLSLEGGIMDINTGTRSEDLLSPEVHFENKTEEEEFYERLRRALQNIGIMEYAFESVVEFIDNQSLIEDACTVKVNREIIKKARKDGKKRLPDLDDEAAVQAFKCRGDVDEAERKDKIRLEFQRAAVAFISDDYHDRAGCTRKHANQIGERIYSQFLKVLNHESTYTGMEAEEYDSYENSPFSETYDGLFQQDNGAFFGIWSRVKKKTGDIFGWNEDEADPFE